jgi:acyl-CoA thioesterase
VWLRASDPLPDDPLLHVCAVTYASDLTLLDAVLLGVVQEGLIRVSSPDSWLSP